MIGEKIRDESKVDEMVAEHVMGWECLSACRHHEINPGRVYFQDGSMTKHVGYHDGVLGWSPFTKIADAADVLDKLSGPDGKFWWKICGGSNNAGWSVSLMEDQACVGTGDHTMLSAAIGFAALRSVGAIADEAPC